MNYISAKYFFDRVIALLTLIIILPLFVVIGGLIKLDSKGPIFFKQKRVGINKRHFNILKFRSMYSETPAEMPTHLLDKPDSYVTKVGKILRITSLDELPQLINIALGEMSIVGPRPALWNQFDLINERDKYNANSLKPGLTGWAQVNGRDELPIQIKAKFDGEYVKRISFLMDVRIVFLTFIKVVKKEGIRTK